jgi:hypothetical protein
MLFIEIVEVTGCQCHYRRGRIPSGERMPESEGHMSLECMEIRELLILYYEGKLSDEQKAYVNRHLAFCPDCVCHMVMESALAVK